MAKLNKTPLTIRAKRGTASQIESFAGYQLSGEFAYATDTNELYVSNGSTFVAMGEVERTSYPISSPDGTSFIIVAGNDGTLAAIPPTSTAPSITTLPTISGTLNVGETLTATAGNVSGEPTPTRVLQWQRSDNGTTGWADISGATGTSYLLVFNDEDKYIRVAQTEENILGTATANSASTTQIGPAAFVGLLDDYPNAAAAYSLRKLRNFYTGDAIIVRRASDNATQSIGFVNNELDTASLESFCAGTDGFVTTWYDQSGNGNDAAQASASSQPKIVSSGSTILENGKAAVEFDGNDHMPNGVGISTPTNVSAFAVRGISSYPTTFRTLFNYKVFGLTHNANGGSDYGNGAHIFKSGASTKSDDYPTTTGQAVDTIINKTNLERNAFAATLATGDNYNDGISGIGSWRGTTQTFVGTIQELVIYESDESANKSGIQTNINAFYNIY